jgi:hypothetical protein
VERSASSHARHVGLSLLIGLGLTLASTMVEGHAPVTYADIDSCLPACSVVVAGFPFAFIADYPGISPVGSVSLLGALLGIDRIHGTALSATLATWSLVGGVSVGLLRARRRVRQAARRVAAEASMNR